MNRIKRLEIREYYRVEGMTFIFYSWESRIKTFFLGIKRAFIYLMLAFRVLMRISPSVD